MKGKKLRPTNAANDSKGEFLWLEGKLAFGPLGVGFCGVLVYTIIMQKAPEAWFISLFFCFSPAVITFLIVRTFIHKREAGYLWEWLDSNVMGKFHGSYRNDNQPKWKASKHAR